MKELLENETDGIAVYQDDIIISKRTEEEHDKHLNRILNTIEKSELKLNRKKCLFKQTHLNFLGHRLVEMG